MTEMEVIGMNVPGFYRKTLWEVVLFFKRIVWLDRTNEYFLSGISK